MVLIRPEPVCRAKELRCYLQGQGHSEGLYNHDITVSSISSELMILFATEPSLSVDHHKKVYFENKVFCCCVKVQGHSNGSKFYLMFFSDGTF